MRALLLLVLGCQSTPASFPDAAMTMDSGTPSPDAGVEAGPMPEDLGPTLDPIRQANNLPALAGAVWKGRDLIAIGATGVRKNGDPTAATTGDKWHLGSDTKAMTATLIGLYVDRKKIKFEDTIATLFSGETIDPGYANVTLEQLLQHRGGAPATVPNDIWMQMWADGASPGARIKAVRSLIARPPAQAPGTYVYANAGYIIADAALERVTGSTWESMMTSEIFGTLGMASCGFGAPGTPNVVDQPWGHNGVTPVSPDRSRTIRRRSGPPERFTVRSPTGENSSRFISRVRAASRTRSRSRKRR